MTDTPTPPTMTPEQRALLSGWLREPYDCTHGDDVADMEAAADQLEADGVTIATLTAECDAAQAEIARLTAALATAREDGMREAIAIASARSHERKSFHSPFSVPISEAVNAIEAAIQKGAAT